MYLSLLFIIDSGAPHSHCCLAGAGAVPELLIVGIDGGTASIFDAFDMPFWHLEQMSHSMSRKT